MLVHIAFSEANVLSETLYFPCIVEPVPPSASQASTQVLSVEVERTPAQLREYVTAELRFQKAVVLHI